MTSILEVAAFMTNCLVRFGCLGKGLNQASFLCVWVVIAAEELVLRGILLEAITILKPITKPKRCGSFIDFCNTWLLSWTELPSLCVYSSLLC